MMLTIDGSFKPSTTQQIQLPHQPQLHPIAYTVTSITIIAINSSHPTKLYIDASITPPFHGHSPYLLYMVQKLLQTTLAVSAHLDLWAYSYILTSNYRLQLRHHPYPSSRTVRYHIYTPVTYTDSVPSYQSNARPVTRGHQSGPVVQPGTPPQHRSLFQW